MKLRFEKNSLRLRLRKSDLQKLAADGRVAETVPFGTAVFSYVLQSGHTPEVNASLESNCIVVTLPKAQADKWMQTDEVALSAQQGDLLILVEKDFPCKDRAEEDKSDTFVELVPQEKDLSC